MAGGLIALLDDIATLAKATASSLDDIAVGAAKASSKAVGVVIDDTAITPQYVAGLDPSREIPIIKKIARASLINKLAIILPVALILTWLAPWLLPVILIIGGSYLCFEGGEKALTKLHLYPEHVDHKDSATSVTPEEIEMGIVSSATRTDLILSAEIMLISLADVTTTSNLIKVGIMVGVAFFMTFFVYGIVGTVAMLWVGGHIVISSLNTLGFTVLHHIVEHGVSYVEHLGGAATWTAETVQSGIFGLIWGIVLAYIWLGISSVIKRVRHTK